MLGFMVSTRVGGARWWVAGLMLGFEGRCYE